jgi:UDP-glucuronate 4-epimerase
MKILVTGAAGFIGSALSKRLVEAGHAVVGIDNLNDYYDVNLKLARLERLQGLPGFRFEKMDIVDRASLEKLFAAERFDKVAHLAAQAGVRYSILNPYAYVETNLVGFVNILEGCRHQGVKHLVYASTSSVYGLNTQMPFSEHQGVDHPVSLYGATKKANESMAHSYSHMYGLPTTGLRFFTVYGPWGRPDMALFSFTKDILAGKPIDVFNHGKHLRDFTYIDDIVEGVARTLENAAPAADPKWNSDRPDPASSSAPYRIFNIGNSRPVELLHYIELLEENLGKKAQKNFLPLQQGDVPSTFADVSELEAAAGYRPSTSVEVGVARFVQWYREYFKVAP